MHDPFAIRLELSSPVILDPSTIPVATLDGVLGAALFDSSGDGEAALHGLPLGRTETIWHASSWFIEEPFVRQRAPFVRATRASRGFDPDNLRPDGRKFTPFDIKRRQYRQLLNERIAFATGAVWAFGEGDLEAIEDLLSGVAHIGAKRGHGFGKIALCEVFPVASEIPPCFGIVDMVGAPARPVPVPLWSQLSNVEAPIATVPARYPRWLNDPEPCVVPAERGISPDRMLALIDGEVAA